MKKYLCLIVLTLLLKCNDEGYIYDVYQGGVKIDTVCLTLLWANAKAAYYKETGIKCKKVGNE